MGEKAAGISSLFSCLTRNSRVDGVGGQLGSLVASARIRVLSFKSLYGQMCTHLFSEPSSLYMPAAKGEYFSRAEIDPFQLSMTLDMAPGW